MTKEIERKEQEFFTKVLVFLYQNLFPFYKKFYSIFKLDRRELIYKFID